MPTITSRQNPIVSRYRAVAKGVATDQMLLDGVHLIEEALGARVAVREAAVADPQRTRPDIRAVVDRLLRLDVPVSSVSRAVMDALSPVRSASPVVAIGARPPAAELRAYVGAPLVVMACDVQDPGNVGAIVRVAEAGGADGVVCAGACADPFDWKALRGSMGSALRLPVLVRPDIGDAVAEARQHGCRIVASVPRGGRAIADVNLRGAIGILIGGEGAGLSPALIEAADERVTIPMTPPVESLNVAVSAALLVYEARRQRGE